MRNSGSTSHPTLILSLYGRHCSNKLSLGVDGPGNAKIRSNGALKGGFDQAAAGPFKSARMIRHLQAVELLVLNRVHHLQTDANTIVMDGRLIGYRDDLAFPMHGDTVPAYMSA
jgi:hypothetical protein